MSEMVPTGSKYTDVQRKEAMVAYAIGGNMAAIERSHSVPKATLHYWVHSDWGIELLEQVRTENQNEHISQYHELTRKALRKADLAIDNLGDDLSAGDIKALVVTGATATDKARLLLGLSTSNPGKGATMAELQAQFEKLAANHKAIQATVIDEQ